MARGVSDSQAVGARERLALARELFTLLREQLRAGAAHSRLLALRGATITHAYAALVSLMQQAAKTAGVPGWANQLSLAALERAFTDAGLQAPEQLLLAHARTDHNDLVVWLEHQLMALYAPEALSRRPLPRSDEEASLTLAVEDPGAPLHDEDLARLDTALRRVAALIQECATHSGEW